MADGVETRVREELGRVGTPPRDLPAVRRRAGRLRARRWAAGAVAGAVAAAGVALPLVWLWRAPEGTPIGPTPDPSVVEPAPVIVIGDGPDTGEVGWEPATFEAVPGWYLATTGPVDPDTDWAPVAWAATVSFAEADLDEARRAGSLGFPPRETLLALGPDDVVLVATIFSPAAWPAQPTETLPEGTLPLFLSDADVRGNWEGQPDPEIPEHVLWRTVEGWQLDVRAYFGTQAPSEDVLAEAQQQLARLSLPEPPAALLTTAHADVDDGVRITMPSTWTFHQDPSGPDDPRTLLAFGTWVFQTGGDCAPSAAQAELPADGAFVWMMEYLHPETIHFSNVQPRPANFAFDETTLANYECSLVPSYLIRFSEFGDDGRVFQVHAAFGSDATQATRDQVIAALDDMVITAPVPGPCPFTTGPWGDPNCPAQAWVREVAAAVDAPVTDNTGSALELDLQGHLVHLWAFLPETDEPYEEVLTAEGYTWRWGFGTDVYSDGTRIAWMADGLWVWMSSATPDPLPPEAVIEDIVRASLEVDYDAIDTR